MIKTCACGVSFRFTKAEEFKEKGYKEQKKCARCAALSRGTPEIFENRSDIQNELEYGLKPIGSDWIQTGKFDSNAAKKTIFKFMGPNSDLFNIKLKESYSRILYGFADGAYEVTNTYLKNINGVYLYVICRRGELMGIKTRLNMLITQDINTVFPITFKEHFSSDKDFIDGDVWVDVHEDYIFTFGEERILEIVNYFREIYDPVDEWFPKIIRLETLQRCYFFREKLETEMIDSDRIFLGDIFIDKEDFGRCLEVITKEIAFRLGRWE